MHVKPLIAIGAMLSGAFVSAADCGSYGLCGALPASTRNQLYAARQHVCGDGLYKNDGSYKAEGGGRLSWPGGFDQQRCWDAFENILDKCRPEGSYLHNHSGTYNWYGKIYRVHGCTN